MRSESPNGSNFIKKFNINIYDDDNINNKIKTKINIISLILTKLDKIITNNSRKTITKELYEILDKLDTYSQTKKEEIYNNLLKTIRTLEIKQALKNVDFDAPDYFGIRDIEMLFNDINHDDYCKPILVKSAFKNNYEYYEIRGTKEENQQVDNYLKEIIPHIHELIEIRKSNNRNEQKIQMPMLINFSSSVDSYKSNYFYINCKNVEITQASDTNEVIRTLINSFKSNLYKQEQILRGASDYIYNCVDITGISFHNIKMKRGASYITAPKWI